MTLPADGQRARRVLLIGNNIGSMLQFRAPLIRALVAAGDDVHLLVPTETVGLTIAYGEQLAALRALGATVHEYALQRSKSNPLFDVGSIVDMAAQMRRIAPDAVLSYMMKPVIYGSLVAWLVGVPRRYAMLDGLGFAFAYLGEDKQFSLSAWIARRLLKSALAQAHHLILLNRDDPVTLRQLGIIPADFPLTIVAGTGIDLTHYAAVPVNTRSTTFVMIARLLREKGVRDYAQAAALVRQQRPDARFVLLGEIDPAPGAIDMAEVKSWEAVDYLGSTRDVRPHMAESLAFVLPSYYGEGRPRTVMEAMAMQRACIVADNRGSRDSVEDGMNGQVVPPRNPERLAAAMLNYLSDPTLAVAHGVAGRRLAEAVYAEDRVVRDTLAALDLAPAAG
jgi:glycosyltransferase involved in cell wall biosynthesis